MDFDLPQDVGDLARELRRWVDHNRANGRPGRVPFEQQRWTEFLRWELLGSSSTGRDAMLQTAAAFIEIGRGTLPGPVLEAYLAVASGCSDAAAALHANEVVASVCNRTRGSHAVGWGHVAALTVSQLDGTVLARSPLPRVEMSYAIPHGWLEAEVGCTAADVLDVQRWVAGAALLTGLSLGAIDHAREHVSARRQFGRPLGEFEAVQLPLAESFAYAEGMRLTTLDAAWRVSVDDPYAAAAAALAWIWCDRAAHRVADVCHQSFGASGFCDDTGLTQYTWAIAWLRLSVGTVQARRAVRDGRAPCGPQAPPSLVLPGFSVR
jgi:hypothetical protein